MSSSLSPRCRHYRQLLRQGRQSADGRYTITTPSQCAAGVVGPARIVLNHRGACPPLAVADVRLGSQAGIAAALPNVRFTPESITENLRDVG